MAAPPVASTSSAVAAPATLDTTSAVADVVFQRRRGSARVRETFAALAAQEKALQADPKWKKYSSLVEKTLQSFEQVQEWADFQVFLAKLLKCLQAYREFPMIPHKLTVAKRLSQCLNPALPTGVHQRALDLYTHILTTIGPENLRRDLPAWSTGLFPFFQYAATSVKPIVLGIFERFYLPLQESLRPATKAVILALLPGLEEETGEFFEKVAALLDRVSGTVSPAFFFQNLWLVLITAPNSRIPALNYLAKRLPKIEAEDSVTQIVGDDVGLMIRGLAAALEDPQILVQRGILDLLTSTLKLDSKGFKGTRLEDQILLMRAVSGVVLRRDLSLSRRLYTWLLGSSESSDSQIAHLKEHGLGLLRSALKADMDAQTTDSVDRQRPFKIFISLLDKWEIGAPLTEVLVLDAFAALQTALRPGDDHDELLMTGNMLFEILDPFLMWKQIFCSLSVTIDDDAVQSEESIALVRFIIRVFRLHDEEVQKLHAPFIAFSILDRVEARAQQENGFLHSTRLVSAVSLANTLLHEISPKLFEATDTASEPAPERLGLSLAEALYGAADMKTASLPETEGREILASGIATVLRLIERCATELAAQPPNQIEGLQQLLIASLETLFILSDATAHSDDLIQLPWQVDSWTRHLMRCLKAAPASVSQFPLHSNIISAILTLSKTPTIHPPLRRNQRALIEALSSKLLEYLQPACAPCFVESVRLLWGVESLSDRRHVESMISSRLASEDPAIRFAAFEAFGNLWRFTEDAQLPGVVLRMPMFRMLDSLKSEDLATRRAGEAWMRCSLKSYIRVLDPLIFTVLDPAIQHHSTMLREADLRIPVLQYRSSFDQARVHHALDGLLSLARFGGQGFIRIAKSAFLKHSLDPALRQRILDADLDTQTYLDGLITVLVRFLRAEPSPELVHSLDPLNQQIHSVVAELLQVIISRGEAEVGGLSMIESALASRLFLTVHRSELDLQNKLLHVLHSTVHAVSNTSRRHHKSPSLSTDISSPHEVAMDSPQPPDLTREALFVRIVADAISIQQNNAVIHHWVDFLLMTIPQYRQALHAVIFPLIDCLVERLRSLVDGFSETYQATGPVGTPSTVTDAEYTVLVNALERLLLIAAAQALTVSADEEPKTTDRVTSDPSSSGAGGLLGYMTGVLGSSEVEHTEISEETKTKYAALRRVRSAVDLLLYSWDVTSILEAAAEDDSSSSKGHFASRSRTRARKALERIYKAAPTNVLDEVVVYWWKNRSTQTGAASKRIHSIVGILAPSAQTVVSMICDKLGSKGPVVVAERNKNPFAAPDDALFAFLEAYIDKMDGAAAIQIWSVCLNFVREWLSNLSVSRPYIFLCLRCFTVLSEKVSQTSALEDRRMRRDLQETFIRLADASIQLAGRAMESSGWLRRAVADNANGDSDSIMSRETKEHDDDEEKRPAPAPNANQAREVTEFMARRVLADFRRFLIDTDKTVAVCSNMLYYIVAPAFKTRSKTFDIDASVFELLIEMSKNPQTIKAWRTQVGDAFADNRFFNAPPSANLRWKPLIQALMASDKERLVELTARISTAASANIFTNRELESLSRALSLRRLTYVLFTGDKDRYLTQLPLIQEKLVDLLRSPVGDMVHAEVYLCLRVLFCRIGNQHLTGLWPVILTELLRLFESLVDFTVPDRSELLQLVLSACKFLDLTLVLQTEDFQIHEWMFVTDTVDAIYPPDNWLPQAIMDRLGELIPRRTSDSPLLIRSPNPTASSSTLGHPRLSGRRPMLAIRKIDSIGELEPFFAGVSLAAYESIYDAGGRIDTDAVERTLERDIFDGNQT